MKIKIFGSHLKLKYRPLQGQKTENTHRHGYTSITSSRVVVVVVVVGYTPFFYIHVFKKIK